MDFKKIVFRNSFKFQLSTFQRKIKRICNKQLIVPAKKYHKQQMQKMSNAFEAQVTFNANATVITRPVNPKEIKMDFIKVDSGSIPIFDTSFAQGPSCPAYFPAAGLT